MLTHRFKNPNRPSCVRCKVKQRPCRRVIDRDTLDLWGRIVTCDHVDSRARCNMGVGGEAEAFVIKDIFSGLVQVYPSDTTCAYETVQWIRNFRGARKIESMYSEHSGEVASACKKLGILHETSAPYVPQTNGISQ